MAQSRLTDTIKVLNGFGLVAKAFGDVTCNEAKQLWSNSSLRGITEALQFNMEERFSDSMVSYAQTAEEKIDLWDTAGTEPFDTDKWMNKMGFTGMEEIETDDSQDVTNSESQMSSSSDDKSSPESNAEPQKNQPHVLIPNKSNGPSSRSFHTFIQSRSYHSLPQNVNRFRTFTPYVDHVRKHLQYASCSGSVTADTVEKLQKKTQSQPPKQPPKVQTVRTRLRPKLSDRAKERSVPSTRLERVISFGGLAAGLGIGAVAEKARRSFGFSKESNSDSVLDGSIFLTEANAQRIVETLCRVRGAALKLGQMLSIQDNTFISPQLQDIFERVRQSADFMPTRQMEKVLKKELGDDWKSKVEYFEEKPFAAASIGQVHLARLHNGQEVAMKIQYPGVAESIESDINNLMTILSVWSVLPPGLYAETAIEVAKKELAWEVDYIREAECSETFRKLLKDDKVFIIPAIIPELSAKQVITSELVEGVSLEKADEFDQETRNYICSNILRLCLAELYDWNIMQTDPNWSNFMYNPETRKIALLDFGATRLYDKAFVDTYLQIIKGASTKDRQAVLENSIKLGFLTSYETEAMKDAHVDAVMILGEPFSSVEPFDFATQDTTRRIQKILPVMLDNRLSAPPEESYSLHRKLSGAFLLCTKLRAKIQCKDLFDSTYANYKFSS